MKRNFLFTLITLSLSFSAFSQDLMSIVDAKTREDSLKIGWWDKSSQLGINFSQASFNDAWQGGGINNYSLGTIVNAKADHYKGKGTWTNDFQFQYGILHNRGRQSVKSIDRLFFESKYGHKISPKVSWFAGVNFLSQVAKGYEYDDKDGSRVQLISNFLAPGYLSEGIGIEWKPVNYMVFQLGGAAMRQTFVIDDNVLPAKFAAKESRYGVEYGKKMLNEAGIQLVAAFDKDVMKNFNLKWRYQGFWAYAPTVKTMDHNLNLIATAKINKYMSANFTLIAIFDKDQVENVQFSESFGLGISYIIGNVKK